MNWYCIYTKSKKEELAIDQLSNQLGFEVYFPRILRQKTVRRIRREVNCAVFPRYLFCRCDLATEYRAVRYARDVVDIVGLGNEPTVVSAELIQDLKDWTSEASLQKLQPKYVQGEHVLVSEGPMRGLRAVILAQSTDGDRVSVLLSILGCGARLKISSGQLDKSFETENRRLAHSL